MSIFFWCKADKAATPCTGFFGGGIDGNLNATKSAVSERDLMAGCATHALGARFLELF